MRDEPPPSAQDALDALLLLQDQRHRLDVAERRLIDMARRAGASWPQVARALDPGQGSGRRSVTTAQGAQQRRRRLEAVGGYMDRLVDPERVAGPPAQRR